MILPADENGNLLEILPSSRPLQSSKTALAVGNNTITIPEQALFCRICVLGTTGTMLFSNTTEDASVLFNTPLIDSQIFDFQIETGYTKINIDAPTAGTLFITFSR